MLEEAFGNQRISNFQGVMTSTLNQVIWHTIVHHSSTSTYMPNFIQIGKLFADRQTYEWTSRPNKFIWFTQSRRLPKCRE